jgi:pilus assembly protein Flp/PilA
MAGTHGADLADLRIKEAVMNLLQSFLRDRRGATVVEYGLLVSILAVTLAAALGNYYDLMNNMFGNISLKLNTAN